MDSFLLVASIPFKKVKNDQAIVTPVIKLTPTPVYASSFPNRA
jgi:hypothetical protein